jgi:hypothetical protein
MPSQPLADDLVPDELWALVEPLAAATPPRPGGAAGVAPSPTATASPRSSPWPALSTPGGCSQRKSWAVARRPRSGAAVSSESRQGVGGLHLDVLDRLGLAGRLDWSRASVDSAT